MRAIQIPVTIPQGVSSQAISQITEKVTMYAQFLFSQTGATAPNRDMSMQEAMQYLDTLAVREANVPADINGMKDICNPKDFQASTIPIYSPSNL